MAQTTYRSWTKNSERTIRSVLEQTLTYARARNYTGHDYADGLSSKILQAIPIENKWLNLFVQESIKRFPVNIRPLMLVPQRQSYKGTALFAMANHRAYLLTGNDRYKREHEKLLGWLINHRTEGYSGFCGGHRHALQDFNGRIEPKVPDLVSTSYAIRALLEDESQPSYVSDLAETGAEFLVEDLGYTSTHKGACIKYRPTDTEEYYVLNANALAARTFVDLFNATDDDRYLERAEALLQYVVARQTDIGGWMYTDPPDASHLSMDNHHNGFIIESLLRYKAVTGSMMFAEATERGLQFYGNTLFQNNGAPNWDENSAYPRDIHAAAQGIITFSLADQHRFANQILHWTLDTLYAGEGRFYYQQRRFYTKRITLMRWCQAWMAFGLAYFLSRNEIARDPG